MTHIIILLVTLLLPFTAQAEPIAIPISIYATAAALDLHSTHHFLGYNGLREGNPIGAWLSDRPTTLVVYSAALDASAVYLLHHWIGAAHPRLERVSLYAVAATRTALAIDNYRSTAGHLRR